jgi:hypothetical protein
MDLNNIWKEEASCFECGLKFGHIYHTFCLESSKKCPICLCKIGKMSLSEDMKNKFKQLKAKATNDFGITLNTKIGDLKLYGLIEKYNEFNADFQKTNQRLKIIYKHFIPSRFEHLKHKKINLKKKLVNNLVLHGMSSHDVT